MLSVPKIISLILKKEELRFKKQPKIVFSGSKDKAFNDTVFENGKVIKSKIIINKKLLKHLKFAEMIVRHELRETLFIQNNFEESNKTLFLLEDAHSFALKKEEDDLKELNFRRLEYKMLIRKYGWEL